MHLINLFNIEKKHIFHCENNHSLEQPSQGCGIVPTMVFKICSGGLLDNLIKAPCTVKGWTRRSFKVPSKLGYSIIL